MIDDEALRHLEDAHESCMAAADLLEDEGGEISYWSEEHVLTAIYELDQAADVRERYLEEITDDRV